MFRIVKEPFMMAWSRSQHRKYWFNTVTRQSIFECPREATVDFKTAFTKKFVFDYLI